MRSRSFSIPFIALALACACCASGRKDTAPDTATGTATEAAVDAPRTGKDALAYGTSVTVTGVIVAYGSEPHTILMIRALDGRFYYPSMAFQKALRALERATYAFTGILDEALPAGQVLVPPHVGVFRTLAWERRGP